MLNSCVQAACHDFSATVRIALLVVAGCLDIVGGGFMALYRDALWIVVKGVD